MQSTSTPSTATNVVTVYACGKPWNEGRPRSLVIACSDGRMQEQLDEFLQNHLGIQHYDRMYVPGGPGALSSSGFEFMRPDQLRRECTFLVEAHAIRDLILIFHGSSDDGPEEAACADYRRKMPNRTSAELNAQQRADIPELLRVFSWPQDLRIHIYRAEVTADNQVRFVDLQPAAGS